MLLLASGRRRGLGRDSRGALDEHARAAAPTPPPAPPPAPAASIQLAPCCSSTSSRTTDSPIPLPPVADSAARFSRTYGSQTRTRSLDGMPGPSSSTQTRTRDPSVAGAAWLPTVIVWPAGPYLAALSSRLSRI